MFHAKLYFPSLTKSGLAIDGIERSNYARQLETRIVEQTGNVVRYAAIDVRRGSNGQIERQPIEVFEFFPLSATTATAIAEDVCRQLNQEYILLVLDGQSFLARGTEHDEPAPRTSGYEL